MNCFQFDYFCGYHTAILIPLFAFTQLWIAFNLITFVDITQRVCFECSERACCELLSIWLLLWISHSEIRFDSYDNHVVNCFQFDYFCGYHTALATRVWFLKWLWIAFNLITFVDITQHTNFCLEYLLSCELLSIWLLLWISHSVQALASNYQDRKSVV